MSTITVEVKDNLLVLSDHAMERLGWREDTKISIERENGKVILRPKELTPNEIANLACIHLIKKVGDATAVKMPVWQDGKWRVEVVLSYRPETIGYLAFSSHGQLIEGESDSPAKLKGFAV